MARKPASKPVEDTAEMKPDDKITDTAAPADAGDKDTKGGDDKAGKTAAAPTDAPSTQPEGHKGGEDGSDLPATSDAGGDAAAAAQEAAEAELKPVVPDTEGLDLPADAAWMVICHRKDGRRRAGRRWPAGETPVKDGELSDYDLAILRGDPQFTVLAIEAD